MHSPIRLHSLVHRTQLRTGTNLPLPETQKLDLYNIDLDLNIDLYHTCNVTDIHHKIKQVEYYHHGFEIRTTKVKTRHVDAFHCWLLTPATERRVI